MNLKRKDGFTLLEVLVASVVFILIIGITVSVLIVGKASWYMGAVHIELQQDLRRATDWMMDEFRHTGSGYIAGVPPDGSWQNTITFNRVAGEASGYKTWDPAPVQYALGGINNMQLIRTYGNEQRILGNNILGFQVRRMAMSPGIIEVQMQAQKRAVSGHLIGDNIRFETKLRN